MVRYKFRSIQQAYQVISWTFSNCRTNVMWIMCHHRYWEWIMPALAVINMLESNNLFLQNIKVCIASNSDHPTLRTVIYINFGLMKKWSDMSVFKIIVINNHVIFCIMDLLQCFHYCVVLDRLLLQLFFSILLLQLHFKVFLTWLSWSHTSQTYLAINIW